ncbi:MAG: hypothetical protein OEZ36_12950 [Spirochaetota bacterium]|nr:hypothetical protein [Spirochaetota bacterium]
MGGNMPLDKLLNVETQKYQIARVAMQIVHDIGDFSVSRDNRIIKPAVFALAKVLNAEVSYEVNEKGSVSSHVPDEDLV